MRWIVSFFTLGGLLIGVGVLVYVEGQSSVKVLKQSQPARDEAQQLSGRDTDGTPVAQTFAVQGENVNGKLKDLVVTSIDPNSAMQRYYGLAVGDKVTQIGQMGVGDNNDVELATALLQQAYQQKQALVVIRNGATLTLNGGDTPAPDGNPAQAPANPSPTGTQLPGGVQLPPGVQVPGQQ